MFERYTRSTYFILPMIGLRFDVMPPKVLGVFIHDHVQPDLIDKIHVAFEAKSFTKDHELMMRNHEQFLDIYTAMPVVMVAFDVPENFREDYQLFKIGKYSHFSREYKRVLWEYYPRFMDNDGTLIRPWIWAVISPNAQDRKEVSKIVGQELDEGAEVHSVPNLDDESFCVSKL